MSPHSRHLETQHDFQLYTCAMTRIQQYNVNEANHTNIEKEFIDQSKQFCTVVSVISPLNSDDSSAVENFNI